MRLLPQGARLNKDVSPALATLAPRPDSETVVEAVLAQFPATPGRRVLDFGSGSGCLLLAVLSERPEWSGVGIDIAEDAVAISRANPTCEKRSGRCVIA